MDRITLPGTGIKTTPIGFGCAGLMRTTSTKGRQKLLNTAFDSGIRHFDVARMYGLGQAEAELGKFMCGRRRSEVTITTKFGIEVSQGSSRLAPIINAARYMIKIVPPLRKLINNRTSNLYQERNYDVVTAQACLEKSLSELHTDYIDFFLLHEPSLSHLENTDVLNFLEKAKEKGQIKAYGIAGYTQDCLDICGNKPDFVNVLQIPNDMLEHQLDSFSHYHNNTVFTFSPYSNALGKIINFMKSNQSAKQAWSEKLGLDCSSASNISKLLLRYCLEKNPKGVVICSSTSVKRVKQMTDVINDESFNHAMLDQFASFIQTNVKT